MKIFTGKHMEEEQINILEDVFSLVLQMTGSS